MAEGSQYTGPMKPEEPANLQPYGVFGGKAPPRGSIASREPHEADDAYWEQVVGQATD